MATELITFKMDSGLLKDVDMTVKSSGFHNRTEFIRQALRDKIDEIKVRSAIKRLDMMRGKSQKHITEEEYEKVRKLAAAEFR